MDTLDRFISKKDDSQLTGLSSSSIWRREHVNDPAAKGRFPARIYLSKNKAVWRLSEVIAWMDAQVANDNSPGTPKGAA